MSRVGTRTVDGSDEEEASGEGVEDEAGARVKCVD